MSERPERVTVVSWIVLVFSAFGIMGLFMMGALSRLAPGDNPMFDRYVNHAVPLPVQTAIMGVHIVVVVLCAVGFLRRVGWARHVYVAVNVVMLTYSAWLNAQLPFMPWSLLAGMILPVAVCWCVYSKPSRDWFDGKAEPAIGT